MSDLQCACTVLVARHGEAEYESDLWSDSGGSLTSEGRDQARRLGERLSDRRVARVFCSPMARAVQTAEIAAGVLGCDVTVRNGLREFAVGEHEGVPLDVDPFAPVYRRWLDGDHDARITAGESGAEVSARYAAVLNEIADLHRGETVLAISHGGATRLTLPLLAGGPPRAGAYGRLGNGEVVEMRGDADGWVCERWAG